MATELMKAEPMELSAPVTPMQMIQVAFDAAIKQGSAMEVVNLILEQQRWMIQHQEEEAFNAALKRIQKNLKKIPKRGFNKETQSHYALAEDVDNEIQKHLDAENMTLSYRPAISDRAEEVVIVGTLSLGAFTKEYPLPMPADGKGAKGGGVMSRTHATGSAITYGKRYLKDLIFDLRFSKDDDGNAAGKAFLATVVAKIQEETDPDKVTSLARVAYKTAKDAKDTETCAAIIAAKDARIKELVGE